MRTIREPNFQSLEYSGEDGDDLDDRFALEPDQSANPRRRRRFLPLIRFLSKITTTTASIVTSSVNATGTATYPLFYCTPSGLDTSSVCSSSIATIALARE